MSFKLTNPPYVIDNTPIYQVDTEDGIMGQANDNGTIIVDKNLSPLEQQDVVRHEKVHIGQMKSGDLSYTDTHVIWKGKEYDRSKFKEGDKTLPWEKPAYAENRIT